MRSPFQTSLVAASLTPDERELLDQLQRHPKVVRLAAMRLAERAPSSFGLTPRMVDVVAAIRDHMVMNDTAPTFDEIGKAVGLASKSSVHRLLTCLEERGIVARLPNSNRSVRIIDAAFAPPAKVEPATKG